MSFSAKSSPLAVPLPRFHTMAGVALGTASTGSRYGKRDDLLFIRFPPNTGVGGVLTKNRIPGVPVQWCRKLLAGPAPTASALLVNAGNANVMTGPAGEAAARACAEETGRLAECSPHQIFLGSTGVIGEKFPLASVLDALPKAVENAREDGWAQAAGAIMTTDLFPKGAVRKTHIDNQEILIQGIAKGSGMIAPNMATMLAYIVTDARLPSSTLQALMQEGVQGSFNAITVDSDTSTSDMALLFGTGTARNRPVSGPADPALNAFREALFSLMQELARLIVRDGEGATRLITVKVTGARNSAQARTAAFAIANSPLVKTAIAGADPNWGRIVMAAGKSGAELAPEKLAVKIGDTTVARQGTEISYGGEALRACMQGTEIHLEIDLGIAEAQAKVWTCDLTKKYIDINAAYRS